MKIKVRLGDIVLEVDMPTAKPSAHDGGNEHKGAIALIKAACQEVQNLYKSRNA